MTCLVVGKLQGEAKSPRDKKAANIFVRSKKSFYLSNAFKLQPSLMFVFFRTDEERHIVLLWYS